MSKYTEGFLDGAILAGLVAGFVCYVVLSF